MALKELNLNPKGPKNLASDEDDTEDFDGNEIINEIQDELDEDVYSYNPDEDEDVDEEDDDTETNESDEDVDDGLDEEIIEEVEDDLDDQPIRGPRENDRVRTLLEQQKQAKALAAKERRERIQLQNRMVEMQKTSVEASKGLLQSNIKGIKERMKQAHADSNSTALIDLQEELNKAQLDLAALDSWKPMQVEALDELDEDDTDTTTESVEDKFDQAPQAVKDWAKKNTWFRNPQSPKDIRRQQEAVLYSNILVQEGYKMDTPIFFEKIDRRLKELGLVANMKKNDVNSKRKSSDGRKTERKQISHLQRPSRGLSQNQSNKNKVKLDKGQRAIADLYGISEAEFAKELLKIEAAEKRGKRMVTTFE